MKSIVLLGFSTTGKSTIINRFIKDYGNRLTAIDSDKEVSKQYDGHIYNLFLSLRMGTSTRHALDEIATRERDFLRNVDNGDRPLLVAAGPAVPSRDPEWHDFVTRLRPCCLYLKKTAEDVLDGLRNRRDQHSSDPGLASDPGFGCWDNDVTTQPQDGKWVLVDTRKALANIRRHMQPLAVLYEQYSSQTFCWPQYRDDPQELNTAIRDALGLPAMDAT